MNGRADRYTRTWERFTTGSAGSCADRSLEKTTVSLASTVRPSPRFAPGRIFATPAVVDALTGTSTSINDLVNRHVCGDWGDLSEADCQQNELSVATNRRILSSYVISGALTVWLITESDRSATTILLPGEY